MISCTNFLCYTETTHLILYLQCLVLEVQHYSKLSTTSLKPATKRKSHENFWIRAAKQLDILQRSVNTDGVIDKITIIRLYQMFFQEKFNENIS